MATNVSSTPAGNLTQGIYVGDNDLDDGAGFSTFGGMVAGVDADESMLPAEEGAAGLVGPVTGAQHAHNAAQPGSMG